MDFKLLDRRFLHVVDSLLWRRHPSRCDRHCDRFGPGRGASVRQRFLHDGLQCLWICPGHIHAWNPHRSCQPYMGHEGKYFFSPLEQLRLTGEGGTEINQNLIFHRLEALSAAEGTLLLHGRFLCRRPFLLICRSSTCGH